MKILLVEDEKLIAASIKKGLKQENYVVDTAFDGISGLDLAVTSDYDIIILDRLLPGMDGVELTKKIREQKIQAPILFLTAKGQVQDKVEGFQAGADDYLTKPFAFEEFLERIKSLLKRPKDIKDQILQVEDLTLNTQQFEAKRSNEAIKLSSKEFHLLEYLMRNANKVISKEKIINHVWNYDTDILPNTIEVYIGYLRSKIDRSFKNKPPLIHTVRGFGYKIGNK